MGWYGWGGKRKTAEEENGVIEVQSDEKEESATENHVIVID